MLRRITRSGVIGNKRFDLANSQRKIFLSKYPDGKPQQFGLP
jgi:hypothetical protein